ncbi:MAG TPA: DUF4918 family protein, partial [Bacteroidia bacterium]|nr:DUF4918 family protein [Bacteroidia bacterium]
MLENCSQKFFNFLTSLDPQFELPQGIQFINPYQDVHVKAVLKQFCDTYYSKSSKRILILGINPGRFGGGITGISFTDPIALESACHIKNSFEKRNELSSKFIYEMIHRWGGTEKFYKHFLLSAVCPLGFLKGETNYNYYDSPV